MSSDTHCLNCHAELTGRYCSQCGQKALGEEARTLRHLLSSAFQEVSSVDSRLARSVAGLLCCPGRLTRAHILGQRQRYLSAISLFLLANLLFFLAPSLTDFNVSLYDQYQLQPYSLWTSSWIDQQVSLSGLTFDAYAQAYQLRSSEMAKTLVILHVPMLALLTGTAQDVQTALLCVLGVWLLITAVPMFIENILLWWQLKQSGPGDGYTVQQPYLINSIDRLIEIVIGLLLCLKSGGLSQLLYRLRTAGLKD